MTSTFNFLIISAIYYVVNSTFFVFFYFLQNPEKILHELFIYSFLIWILIFITDFNRRIQNKLTLYHKLDDFFDGLEMRKKRFFPRNYFIKVTRGSPIKYFVIIFLISLFFGSVFLKIPSIYVVFNLLFTISITFFANFPAYYLSIKYIENNINYDID